MKYIITCDSRFNKGQKMYYQQGYGFSIFASNATYFEKENAERILARLKYNNPKIMKSTNVKFLTKAKSEHKPERKKFFTDYEDAHPFSSEALGQW